MIRKRGKSYAVEVYNPTTKRKEYVGSDPDRQVAKQLERDAEAKFARGYRTPRTMSEWAERWLTEHPRPEETTNRHNRSTIRAFLAEYGDRPLDGITKAEAHRLASSRPGVAQVVSAMLNDAVRFVEDFHGSNPFKSLGIAKSEGRQNITPLTEDEVTALGDLAVQHHGVLMGATVRALILFGAWVGCRTGETFAVRWSDLDFKQGLVRIERQRRVDGIKPTKTKKARTIILPDAAATAIRGLPLHHVEWVFTTATAQQFQKGSHSYYWRPVRDLFTAQLPASHWLPQRLQDDPTNRLDFYELRHFCGSMLADRGRTDQEIAHQLGNSPETCRKVYIHTYEDRVLGRLREAFDAPSVATTDSERRVGWQEGGNGA